MTAADLICLLSNDFPESLPRLTEFPSGSFMIDVTIGGRQLVAEYIIGLGYGLSEKSTATFGWEGVEQPFETLNDLKGEIVSRLQEERRNSGKS